MLHRAIQAIRELHLPSAITAVAVGGLGGGVAVLLGLPLPMLLGSVLAVATVALMRFRPFGQPAALPEWTRMISVPVIGVSIGAAFTPDVFADLVRWWPSLLALVLYVPLAHLLGFALINRIRPGDPVTSFYGTAPGGFIEAVLLGDEAGAESALLAMMQFLRLILCIIGIPIAITAITGQTVGSASGAVIGGGSGALGPSGWAVLIACGVVGVGVGKLLRFPAAIMTGPLLLSATAHLLGWVEGGPPAWLIGAVQLMIGVTLGARFYGKSPAVILTAIRLSGTMVLVICGFAGLIAVALPPLIGESPTTIFLAFAPGGLAEMSLVALSLDISVIYVTAHHVLRIVLAVIFMRLLAPVFIKSA